MGGCKILPLMVHYASNGVKTENKMLKRRKMKSRYAGGI